MKIGIAVAAALQKERTGVEEYTYQLLVHMMRLREATSHDFFFYSPKPASAMERLSVEAKNNISFVYEPYVRMWHQRVLPLLLEQNKPDVFFSPSQPLPLRIRRFKIPSVVTIHGLEWEQCSWAYPMAQRLYLHWTTARTVREANGIIAPSHRTKEGLGHFFKPGVTPIEVIHHGVSVTSAASLLHRRMGGKKETWRILFVGRKDKRKNILGIVETFHLLRRRTRKPFVFTLLGPPGNDPFAKELRTGRFGSALLENIFEFTPAQAKERYYQKADILLAPSFDEGFGMTILEAQSFGIPVIASDFLQEVAGKGAFYCQPNDPDTLVDPIYRLMSDARLYHQMQRYAKTNSESFSWEQCARSTLRFLLHVANTPRL